MSMALLGPSGRIALDAQVYTLGSEPGNQFVLNDPKVSPRHAVLRLQEQRYSVTDLGSFEGTYLNEQRLGPNIPTFLKNGDRLRIGGALYIYEESPSMPVSPPTIAASSSPTYEPTALAPQASAPGFGQNNPALPPYGQAPQAPAAPAFGQSNPPPYGQAPQAPATPVFGQSNPALPPYGQGNVSSPGYPPYTPPSDPNALTEAHASLPGQLYASQQPLQPGMPPGYPSPAQPKKKSGLKILIIVLVLVLVLGGAGGGIAFYIVHLPQPTISLTSDYAVGSTPAGATATTFRLSGHKFSNTSTITFLLDNAAVPGNSPVQSDSNGNTTATLTVTDDWSVGNHTITAKDAAGYVTKVGVSITIVTAGQAKTPGPHGAPTDSANGSVIATIQASGSSEEVTLKVTGSDNGGTVCRNEDNGQPRTRTGTSDGLLYTETLVSTCSGNYKGGALTYTETVTKDVILFSNGVICTAQTPYVSNHLEGSFTNATAINGTYANDAVTATCKLGTISRSTTVPATRGTWTGNFTAS